MQQHFTPLDTAVIGRAQKKRRDVIVLREDRDWLTEFSARPADMLLRMAARGALIPLGAGRYAISALGSTSLARKSWQPLVHARLAPLGNYYLGFFSALEEHRFTDVSDAAVTLAIGFSSRQILGGEVSVGGRQLDAVFTRRDVFSPALGIEQVRLSRSEVYYRSNPMRTLVDCLWHSELCGSTETWVTAWGRGAADPSFDPIVACEYAFALGHATTRRLGFMLEAVGYSDVARSQIPPRARRSDRRVLLVADRAIGDEPEHDPFWHVDLNVPRERLQGWLTYGK